MEIKQYAPVIIPTLNRYDHFKRCLESLEKCTGADKTDVYVALDYPPSEKYVDGWKKNDEYLHYKEQNHGFKSLNVIRRETNYFLSGKGVYYGIIEMATRECDCYILSEDDNEFSQAFLDFMNQGLEKYKNTPNVTAVCGYNPPLDMQDYTNNIYFSYGLSAWGVGFWKDKKYNYNIDEVKSAFFSFSKLRKIYKRSPSLVYALLDMFSANKLWGDTCFPFYNILNDSYCVFPKTSFVRNWGHDGSGVNCGEGADQIFVSQPIYQGECFRYDDIPVEETQCKAVVDYIRKTYDWKKRIRLILKLVKFYMSKR